mmetsp:Transcript_69248/g.184647  ORF Transcript_69248/g.184647 Transcript_69248/m.184647 type:complete len:268 (-) Transcript_69248:437-1240(-)
MQSTCLTSTFQLPPAPTLQISYLQRQPGRQPEAESLSAKEQRPGVALRAEQGGEDGQDEHENEDDNDGGTSPKRRRSRPPLAGQLCLAGDQRMAQVPQHFAGLGRVALFVTRRPHHHGQHHAREHRASLAQDVDSLALADQPARQRRGLLFAAHEAMDHRVRALLRGVALGDEEEDGLDEGGEGEVPHDVGVDLAGVDAHGEHLCGGRVAVAPAQLLHVQQVGELALLVRLESFRVVEVAPPHPRVARQVGADSDDTRPWLCSQSIE